MAGERPRPSHPLHGRHELLWEGKYDARGRRRLPAAPRGLALQAIEHYPPHGPSSVLPPGWTNRLVLGDNRDAIACLLPELKGAVQLIYLDPPFGSEADYLIGRGSVQGEAAQGEAEHGESGQHRCAPRALAYRDRWGEGADSYLQFMAERLAPMRDLLTPSGCLFLHCDWHNQASLRLMLDELFGADHFVNEIVWYYYNKYSRGRHCLPRAHDSILVYSRTRSPALYPLRLQRDVPRRQLVRRNVGGVLRNARDAQGRLMYQVVHDKKADDVWTIPQLQPASAEWTGYATQKHPLLLERIVALGSRPGDLVADFFCGSGTTLTVAQRLERRFVGADLGMTALHIARRRLIQAPEPRPGLSILRVRGALQAALRRRAGADPAAQRAWTLARMGAEPVPDRQDVHGHLRGLPVHIHLGDAPLTARRAARLALRAQGQPGGRLICGAWDFEPAFWDRLAGLDGSAAVLPVLLPREWLSAPGAAHELRLLPRVKAIAKRGPDHAGVQVTLRAFETPLLAEAIRGTPARAGLHAVDSWAVDTGWRSGQAFTATWVATRPRKPRPLQLTSEPLTLPVVAGARLRVLVQAWDALGACATAWVELER